MFKGILVLIVSSTTYKTISLDILRFCLSEFISTTPSLKAIMELSHFLTLICVIDISQSNKIYYTTDKTSLFHHLLLQYVFLSLYIFA